APSGALPAHRCRRAPDPPRRGRLMGALVGLGFGTGALLVWSAFFLPRDPRTRSRSAGRLHELLARAGMGEVSVSSLLALCAVLGVGALALVQLVSGAFP